MNTLQDVFSLVLVLRSAKNHRRALIMLLGEIERTTHMIRTACTGDFGLFNRYMELIEAILEGDRVDEFTRLLNHTGVSANSLRAMIEVHGGKAHPILEEFEPLAQAADSIIGDDDPLEAIERYMRGELKPLYIDGGLVQPLYKDDFQFEGAICN